ncbi:MAG: DUF3857 domain-containing protein [Bacteroidota bacterium]
MKKKLILINGNLFVLLLFIMFQGINLTSLHAGNDPKYKVADIPKELKRGAIAVIRNQKRIFIRKSLTDAVYKVTEVVTILNKKALDYAYFNVPYDKFSKIRNIKGVIYDEFGNVVKKFNKDDIMDVSAISGGTLFSDARFKYIDPKYRTVPFTIEYSYDYIYEGILSTPSWFIYPGYRVSIEKSSFSVTTTGDLQLRYYSRNIDIEPKMIVDKGNITYKWEVSNLVAIKKEPFSRPLFETTPIVFTAPSDFSIEDVIGNSSSWENFGNWISILNDGRGDISEETQKEIKALLSDTVSELENVKILYQWMQDKTRYVSIQIGIGGWQPMLAEEVDNFSYGDCKALTNYMHSILEVAEIESHYTLVRAGYSAYRIRTNFPSNQFNHAILCVPINNDTIWLECTSQQNPFGYLGDFTDDRDVLVITDEGGKIAHTSVYDKNDNYKITHAIVVINNYGDGNAIVDVKNSGMYYDDLVYVMLSTEKDRTEMVINSIDIPSFELENYSFVETKSIVPVVDEKIELKIKSYATKLGKRLLFEVNILNKSNYQFKRTSKRRNDIVIRREFKESDTIVFMIPNNYKVEAIPSPIKLNTEFGTYSAQVLNDSTQLTYIRNFELNKGTYPSTNYSDFKKFSADIRNADNMKIVLINSTVN